MTRQEEIEEATIWKRVKCPDCAWWQFKDGESVGMTPCPTCNSTGYILKPLAKEDFE